MENGATLTIRTGSGALGKKAVRQAPEPRPRNPAPGNAPSSVSLTLRLSGGSLTADYSLTESVPVTFRLFTMQGRMVLQKSLGVRAPGKHTEILSGAWHKRPEMHILIMTTGGSETRRKVPLVS